MLQVLLAEDQGRRTVITLRGDLDLAVAVDALLAHLPAPAGTAGASTTFALDLSGVTFLDCSGLHALLALEQRIHHDGGELCVSAASPEATLVFDLLADRLEPSGLIRRCRRDQTQTAAIALDRPQSDGSCDHGHPRPTKKAK
jgi:anti-anti-sigma factor